MGRRQSAYGTALLVFGVGGVLAGSMLFYRTPADLEFMTVPGKVAFLVAAAALLACALLLTFSHNLWFRAAGIAALVVFASFLAQYVFDRVMYAQAMSSDPSTVVMLMTAPLGGSVALLDPDGLLFRVLMIALGVATYAAGARFKWLGLDHAKRAVGAQAAERAS